MQNTYKLLIEDTPADNFKYLFEEKNTKEPSTLYITGPYLMSGEVNKNKRRYTPEDMNREVNRYVNEMVSTKRAMGELNHPASAEVNLERACHITTDLKMDGNVWYGRSKVLTTPMGQLVRSLINDGVRVGMSSRALGKLIEEGSGVNRVQDMRLIAIDCVADPSFTKAFVNGILESKQYVLAGDGSVEEYYNEFESRIRNLPKKDVQAYLKEQIMVFIKNIKQKI